MIPMYLPSNGKNRVVTYMVSGPESPQAHMNLWNVLAFTSKQR